jgi:ATP-binding cassette subfamily B (MDR/TAP) protein 1
MNSLDQRMFLMILRLYVVYLFIGRFILAYIAIVNRTHISVRFNVACADMIQIGFRNTSLRVSASIRLSYLEALFRQPISILDSLPPGQTTAIITATANVLQLGISERLSSLIQAITVILTALIIGCIFSWELTLVTASGLFVIVVWYSIMTPTVVRRYAKVQEVERNAASVAHDSLASIRMIAACGAEGKMADRYTTLIERASAMGRDLSPMLAIQHSLGESTFGA